MLGYEFIKQHHGQTVKLASGRFVRIFEVNSYEQHVKETYSSVDASPKRKNLLLDDIPTEFIKRQLNDSRYISRVVIALLSNVVRNVDDDGTLEREAKSQNVITCNGFITSRLKRDWGLGEVWNEIVLPRFQRLNRLTDSTCFTTFNTHGQEIPNMPLEMQKGFKIKRIDHRHHALDAIVIACTTREHVNLLNNESALPENKSMYHALSRKLRIRKEETFNGKKRLVYKEFIMPWSTFKTDTQVSLEQIIISFKQNLRVLNQATNFYTKYKDGERKAVAQVKGDHFAIRKPLHKDTVYGHVNLQKIGTAKLKDALKDVNRIVDKRLKHKVKELIAHHYDEKQILTYFKTFAHEWKGYDFQKTMVFYYTDEKEKLVATRFGNDLVSIFSKKTKKQDIEKVIAQITDTGIQKILTNYLNDNLDQIEFAFSAEGLELMNENIARYNDGKLHKPIYKVRKIETLGQKFQIGQNGNKKKTYVEAAKGTNLIFAVYVNDEGVRTYSTIPLNVVIERMK
jgi:CRISPR-associated endonuclease Csn1